MVTDLDGTLLNREAKISGRSREILGGLIEKGAMISIATARTCATVLPLLDGLRLPLPAVIMNGTALYDFSTREFMECKMVSYPLAMEILSVFRAAHCNCFTHVIHSGELDIYYDRLYHPAEEEFYHDRKDLPMKHYRQADLPAGQEVIYFSAMNQKETILQIHSKILSLPCAKKINASCYADVYHPGYYFLEIYDCGASKRNGVRSLQKRCPGLSVAVFGDNYNDLSMMEIADRSFAVKNAAEEVKFKADAVIESNQNDAVALEMEKLFYGG